jgi:hypothetical protein
MKNRWELPGVYFRRDEGESSSEERTPEVVVAEIETGAPPAEPPATDMEAVFELGATQNELQHLRREVADCQEATRLSNAGVADLARMVSALADDLSQVRQEEVRVQEEQVIEKRASILERMLGG